DIGTFKRSCSETRPSASADDRASGTNSGSHSGCRFYSACRNLARLIANRSQPDEAARSPEGSLKRQILERCFIFAVPRDRRPLGLIAQWNNRKSNDCYKRSTSMTHASVSCARRKSVTSRLVAFFIAASLSAPAIVARQRPQKRPLTHNDYDGWRLIQAQTLSPDGKFVAYALAPEDGDGEVVVRNLETGKEWRAPRGALPTTVPQVNPFAENAALPQPPRTHFTADSRFVVFQILPAKSETARAKKEKKKPEDMPKNAMGIIDVASGNLSRVDRVKNFQVPEQGAGFVAYLLEPKPEDKKNPEDKKGDDKKEERKPEASAQPSAKKEKKKEYGSDLVLRNLNDGTERTFSDAAEYSISKDARMLAYAISSRNEASNGLFAVRTTSSDASQALLSGKGKYTKIAWDEKQTQLAFLSDRDDASSPQPQLKIYGWDTKSPAAIELASASSPGFEKGWVISD